MRGQSPVTSDDATKTWRTATTGERFIVLTPDTATTTVGTFQTFSAKVTNVNGEPVSGAFVDFSESGPGAFRNGNSQTGATTDVNGVATVDVTAGSNETGTQTITAALNNTTECVKLAGNPAGSKAGVCSDSSANTFVVAATPTATTTATATATATPPACRPVTVVINTKTINATGLASVSTVGAAPGSITELQGYSQNHFGTANFANDTTPIDRSKAADSNGAATFSDIRPASNTRLRARMQGCTYAGNSDVINVRAQETLTVTRNGVRKYTFSGVSIPARPGGLIVSLYQITGTPCAAGVEPRNCPSERLIGQDRAEQGSSDSGSPAAYSITLTLPASYGSSARFVVKTGQDAQNAPGRSNARTLSIF